MARYIFKYGTDQHTVTLAVRTVDPPTCNRIVITRNIAPNRDDI